MTLLQLKYAVTIASCSTISEAAKRLFLTQPSLTASIKELEQELGITIFSRTNKGVIVTREGEEFLGYARQVIEQTALIEERYFGTAPGPPSVLCLHTALFVCGRSIRRAVEKTWRRRV